MGLYSSKIESFGEKLLCDGWNCFMMKEGLYKDCKNRYNKEHIEKDSV